MTWQAIPLHAEPQYLTLVTNYNPDDTQSSSSVYVTYKLNYWFVLVPVHINRIHSTYLFSQYNPDVYRPTLVKSAISCIHTLYLASLSFKCTAYSVPYLPCRSMAVNHNIFITAYLAPNSSNVSLLLLYRAAYDMIQDISTYICIYITFRA